MRKLFPFARHAFTMVGRTRRGYAMLSLTIVLSFSMLLGFLLWTDSSLYNEYKDVFHQDKNLVFVANNNNDRSMSKLLKEKASEYGTSHALEFFSCSAWTFVSGSLETNEGEPIGDSSYVLCTAIPRHSWMFFDYPTVQEIAWLDGKEHADVDLKSGEILMDEYLFRALGLEGEAPEFFCNLIAETLTTMDLADEPHITRRFTVVGTIPGHTPITLKKGENSEYVFMQGSPHLVFSLEDVSPEIYPTLSWWSDLAFYTDNPESVRQLAVSMNNATSASYESYNYAMTDMAARTGTKAVIAAALLLLLGINLYGSFANALNDRKFEIGVKRAVGASASQIVRQFLYESLLVMGANILLSVWLVVTAGLVYKVIYEHIPDAYGHYYTFTLYISPASIAMFAACSISLTVVFSLIFSYKSTQVQVVDYLKAE